MKRPGFGIVLVAAAAVIALAVVLLSSGTARRAVASAFSPASGPKVAGAGALTGAAAGGPEAAGAAEIRLADAWKTLDHGDLKSLVANLRAAGFPPEVVRAVVAALLHEQFAARRAQILGDQKVPPYWQSGSTLSLFTSPQMAALRQLAREEQDAMRQLLGPDSATNEMTRLYQQRMFGDLAPEKADALQRVIADYSDLRAQVYADAGNGTFGMLPWDREKLALLDKEQHDDLATLLTPDELLQYDLRSSSTAQRLRSQLAYLNPTQQEFDTIYALQSQFDQRYNPMFGGGMLTPDQIRQRQADQAQLQAQIQAALGAQRYVQYQQSTDPGFQAASRIVSTMQLPADNAAAVWTLQQSVQQQSRAVMSDRSLPSGQRIETLAALDAQANQQLATLLTQAGLDAYKQTGGGMWLHNLDQTSHFRPPPVAPPAATGGH